MRRYNISPLWRSTIGFDRVFDLFDAARHTAGEANYPPCNIERLSDDRYRISLALAGSSPDEITVTAEQSVLTIEGRKGEKGRRDFVYRGISSRPFKRQFGLAAHVRVEGARFDNGLLQIELVREIPDAMKPRRIPIDNLAASDVQQIEREAA
ncbi:heat-shock protein [Bradyrhizobium sp. CCBAU 45394]|uniref:small heat shock protein HspA n=1 Tax=Bradyrhizobium sp. CCBAU 45394 TaxID=1325087 RepID=UPI002302D56D|nr:Hsp20 family protein [Bradyrhizobium sp. CCBAU 45394]MDA9391287.1 heat-shock protein [Bradyrhizobium sp. CCBAU 45394]